MNKTNEREARDVIRLAMADHLETGRRMAAGEVPADGGSWASVAALMLAMREGYGGAEGIVDSVAAVAASIADQLDGRAATIARHKAEAEALADELAEARESCKGLALDLDAARRMVAEAERIERETASRLAALNEKRMNYRRAAARFTFGDLSHGGPQFRALFNAYGADLEAGA